ncbi:acyltransferase family protein [Janibacter sp. G1551]|uniref:acyltransferase family protein n=1 Tax=Janibacter sp. G1551 TaxID=3420440 RepID=UPI003CFFC4FB
MTSTVTHPSTPGEPGTPASAGGPAPTAHKTVLRGDIEGLRAVAVGTVLIYHLGVPALFGLVPRMTGGFVGVDIFFVISGFLITSLLIREATRTGTVSIVDFYARRARRLLPAATTVLLFTAIAGWLILPKPAHGDLVTDVIAATLYVINWALAFRSVDYLAEDAAPSPLQHYWSLSVEEQFYVVWPLMILVGMIVARRARLKPKRLLFLILAVTALASFVYSVLHTRSDPATAYFYTTTRVWELGIGALLAFVAVRLRRLPRAAAQILALAGAALILFSAFAFTSSAKVGLLLVAWPGWAALVPTVGAALVIAAGCATQETLVAKALSIKPMTWIGGLSYAIYLWHWPLIILAEAQWGDALRLRHKLVIGALAVALSWLTKHLIEDPIRFRRSLAIHPGKALAMGGAMMAASLVAAGAVHLTVPKLDPDAPVVGATELIADQQAREWTVKDDPTGAYTTSGPIQPDPALAPEDIPAYYDDDCQVQPGDSAVNLECAYAKTDSDTTFAMLGDSKMGQWFPAVESIANREGMRLDLYLKSACSFSYDGVKDDCAAFAHNVIDHFKKSGAPDVAIVSQGRPAGDAIESGMSDALAELKALGTTIVVLTDNSTPTQKAVYECISEHEDDYAACGYDRAKGGEGRGTPALEAAAKQVGVPVVDLNPWICPPVGTSCPPVIGKTLIYRQGSHVTATYVRSLTPVLHRELSTLGITKTPIADIHTDDIPTGD